MNFSRTQVFGSFIWKLLEKTGVQLITFVVTIILARVLSPSEYGIVAIVTIFINLANVIVDGGLNAALIQKKNADNIDFSTILYASLGLSVLLYIMLYCIAPLIAFYYSNDDLVSVLRFFGIIVFPSAINAVQKAYVSKHLLFRKMFYCSLVAIIFSGIIGIFMAYSGYGVWSLVAQALLNQVVSTILMAFLIEWKPLFVFSCKSFIALFDYGWKIFLTNFIVAIYEDIRGLLICKFYKPEILAFFDRGKQFPSLIMGNINTSIQTILFPTFAEEQDNLQKVKSMVRRATQISCYFVFPLLTGLFVAAEPLVLLLLGDKWLPTVPYVRIFCVALIFMPIQSSNMIAIKSLGYSNIILKLEIIKKTIEAIILVVSFKYDVYAVAYGIVVYNFICIFINLAPNAKLLNYCISEQLLDILPTLIASLFMGVISYCVIFLGYNSMTTLSMQLIVGVLVYILATKLLRIDCLPYLLKTIKGKK